MQNLNEDFKNYYKQRLVESILLEAPSDPGLPGEEMSAGIGGAIRRGLSRLLRKPKPVPVSSPRFPPDNITKIIRKRYPFAFSLGDGGLKWVEVVGDNGTRFWAFQMPDGTIHAVSENGNIIENLPKDFYGKIVDHWSRGGANGGILALPFIVNPDGTILDLEQEVDDTDTSFGELPPDTEAISPYRLA